MSARKIRSVIKVEKRPILLFSVCGTVHILPVQYPLDVAAPNNTVQKAESQVNEDIDAL
jgi:hypothetical protein